MDMTRSRVDPAKLRAARRKAKLKQHDIAEAIGVTASHVGNLERGEGRIVGDQLLNWCRACGVRNPFDLCTEVPLCHIKTAFHLIQTPDKKM